MQRPPYQKVARQRFLLPRPSKQERECLHAVLMIAVVGLLACLCANAVELELDLVATGHSFMVYKFGFTTSGMLSMTLTNFSGSTAWGVDHTFSNKKRDLGFWVHRWLEGQPMDLPAADSCQTAFQRQRQARDSSDMLVYIPGPPEEEWVFEVLVSRPGMYEVYFFDCSFSTEYSPAIKFHLSIKGQTAEGSTASQFPPRLASSAEYKVGNKVTVEMFEGEVTPTLEDRILYFLTEVGARDTCRVWLSGVLSNSQLEMYSAALQGVNISGGDETDDGDMEDEDPANNSSSPILFDTPISATSVDFASQTPTPTQSVLPTQPSGATAPADKIIPPVGHLSAYFRFDGIIREVPLIQSVGTKFIIMNDFRFTIHYEDAGYGGMPGTSSSDPEYQKFNAKPAVRVVGFDVDARSISHDECDAEAAQVGPEADPMECGCENRGPGFNAEPPAETLPQIFNLTADFKLTTTFSYRWLRANASYYLPTSGALGNSSAWPKRVIGTAQEVSSRSPLPEHIWQMMNGSCTPPAFCPHMAVESNLGVSVTSFEPDTPASEANDVRGGVGTLTAQRNRGVDQDFCLTFPTSRLLRDFHCEKVARLSLWLYKLSDLVAPSLYITQVPAEYITPALTWNQLSALPKRALSVPQTHLSTQEEWFELDLSTSLSACQKATAWGQVEPQESLIDPDQNLTLCIKVLSPGQFTIRSAEGVNALTTKGLPALAGEAPRVTMHCVPNPPSSSTTFSVSDSGYKGKHIALAVGLSAAIFAVIGVLAGVYCFHKRKRGKVSYRDLAEMVGVRGRFDHSDRQGGGIVLDSDDKPSEEEVNAVVSRMRQHLDHIESSFTQRGQGGKRTEVNPAANLDDDDEEDEGDTKHDDTVEIVEEKTLATGRRSSSADKNH